MEKASILQHVFAENFTDDYGQLPNAANARQFSNELSRINFTSLVRRAIQTLKVRTTGGPDGISPSFLLVW